MDMREKIKNDIMVKMQYYIDSTTMDILSSVLVETLASVEVVEVQTLPATVDDTNSYIIDLFMLKKAPKLSKKTVNFYMDSIKNLLLKVNKVLTKITSMDVELYLNSLRSTNNEVSLNNQRRNISAFFTWMRKSHIIVENPCDAIEPYKEIQKPIDHMEPEEFEQLKTGCKHKRDRALIEFMRSTAMRVGEVVQVNISDIDWRTGEINIYGEKTRSYRPVYLDSIALTFLSDYIQSKGQAFNSNLPLFTALRSGQTQRLTEGGIRGSIAAIKLRSCIRRNVYPHLFRKTTASNIVKRGGSIDDAGKYLGHKDKSTAGRHYAYVGKDYVHNIFTQYVAAV